MAICDGQEEALRFHLKPGGRLERDILLENRSDKPIAVARVESSCDCLTLLTPLADLTFKPGARTRLRIAVDLSKDPKYVGEFAPELRLLDDNRSNDVSLRVDVEVSR